MICIDGGLGQLHAALDVFKQMDVRPPMVISLAKKEELVHVQGRADPLKLPRNNVGLKLLQYSRDEAHRFAQHYHHILRRKAQLAEGVKQGRRPPAAKAPGSKPSARKKAYTDNLKQPTAGENPHTTLASLPVLQPRTEPEAPVTPVDAEDEG